MQQPTTDQDIAIEVHNLTVSYVRRPVLWDIDFELPTNQLIGIVGPNGSGKTTLLKTIMGLIEPVSGFVELFGKPLDEVRPRVSYVPQRESVDWDFPATVRDVVTMGRYRRGNLWKRLRGEDRDRVEDALEKVGMREFGDRQIGQLSGGQQQRVFIARSLAQQADLYLMDEPFAGVDAASEEAILQLLTTMREEGKTVMIVHHDLNSVRRFFNYVVLLNTRLVGAGPIDEVFTSEKLQEAYGGRLTLLDSLAGAAKDQEFPLREKGMADREKTSSHKR
jgi:manganese/zinc/iron transport system ATP- binding protein